MISILGALFLAVLTSSHGYSTKLTENPFHSWERDILALETVSNFGLTLKCLIDVVGDPDTISAIQNAMIGTVSRAKLIPAYSLIHKHSMDVVYEETSLTVADLASIHPVCANIRSYCQHRSDWKAFPSPQEINDMQTYLSLTGPMAKCLMYKYGEGYNDRIYKIFENAVSGIRKDVDIHSTPVQMVLLQAKYIGTELLKLDNECKQVAITYNHCDLDVVL